MVDKLADTGMAATEKNHMFQWRRILTLPRNRNHVERGVYAASAWPAQKDTRFIHEVLDSEALGRPSSGAAAVCTRRPEPGLIRNRGPVANHIGIGTFCGGRAGSPLAAAVANPRTLIHRDSAHRSDAPYPFTTLK